VSDALDIHHVPQKQPADQVIPGYDGKSGTAIALPREEHEEVPKSRGPYNGDPQQLVERDLANLENHTNAPAEKIEELRNLIINSTSRAEETNHDGR
jgi:hypothetical protein